MRPSFSSLPRAGRPVHDIIRISSPAAWSLKDAAEVQTSIAEDPEPPLLTCHGLCCQQVYERVFARTPSALKISLPIPAP
jgi:hypothetical protein